MPTISFPNMNPFTSLRVPKLSGYVWLGSETKLVHVPEDQANDVQMDAEDEIDEIANDEVQEERQDEDQKDD